MKKITNMIAGAFLALASCNQADVEPTEIARVDQMVFHFAQSNSDEREDDMAIMRPQLDAMFQVMGWPAPSVDEILWWSHSDAVRMFQPAVDSVFPTLERQEFQLSHILDKAQTLDLGLPDNLRFGAVVWGKPQPIVRVDSVVLIALNHYLGPDFEGYSHWEQYRRAEKAPAQLPYDLAAALVATQHPFRTEATPNLLNWMLYEGALVEVRMALVPEAQLSLALGYDSKQLEYLEDHARQIWDEMKLQKAIYSTDPGLIDRYIASAPYSPVLGNTAPGRAGRYIGYKIVREYMRNNRGADLIQMLQPEFYDNPSTLSKSGF